MKPRLSFTDLNRYAPEIAQSLRRLGNSAKESGLEPLLIELVKTRVSQINGCAFCLDMHTRDARKLGESEVRLFLLDAWREAPQFSDRERAALAWAEALTLIAEDRVPDAVFEEAKRHFSDAELANLTASIITINSWNRVMIAYRIPPEVKPG
jgi:AhpD family alkylhydroperoxidase